MTEHGESVRPLHKSRIPAFATRQQEAEFWDTHDVTEYLDELRPRRVRSARNLSRPLTIRLAPDTLQRLRVQAEEKGIGPSTLARMWILEHLSRR